MPADPTLCPKFCLLKNKVYKSNNRFVIKPGLLKNMKFNSVGKKKHRKTLNLLYFD